MTVGKRVAVVSSKVLYVLLNFLTCEYKCIVESKKHFCVNLINV